MWTADRQRDATTSYVKHIKAKTRLTRGYAVPRVGLETIFHPLKTRTFTCGIRSSLTDARASPTD
jgi:hypothetical protein